MQTKTVTYQDGYTNLQGYCAYDDKMKGKRPAVLVVHDWSGCNEFAKEKARYLAKLGYCGFAVDMFGDGIIGKDVAKKQKLIVPFMEDRSLIKQRLSSALSALMEQDGVDVTKIAAIGFCFGGLCVLDLARSGSDLKGVVSFHGLLNPPEDLSTEKVKAKVLVLHGFNDPMVPTEQVLNFADEMNKVRADWQMHVYGNTKHAFTNPEANDPDFGTVYNEIAKNRSMLTMKNFLEEIFA